MSTHWKKFTCKVKEFHGKKYEDTEKEKADVHAYLQQKQLIPDFSLCTIHRYSLTLYIDLQKSEKVLRKEMNRTTRYQVNKGSRENLTITYIHHPTDGDIRDFALFYNPFADEKGIDKCRNDKLQSLRDENMLLLSYVSNAQQKIMAAHAYKIDYKEARMFYSCSIRLTDEKESGISVSIANRYLHWKNILYFKKQGYEIYDFMGLAMHAKQAGGENLNRFKRGFGGIEKHEYQSFIPKSFKGKCLILILKILWRKRVGMLKTNRLTNKTPNHENYVNKSSKEVANEHPVEKVWGKD